MIPRVVRARLAEASRRHPDCPVGVRMVRGFLRAAEKRDGLGDYLLTLRSFERMIVRFQRVVDKGWPDRRDPRRRLAR